MAIEHWARPRGIRPQRRSKFGPGVYQQDDGKFYARLVRGGGTKWTRKIKTSRNHATVESARAVVVAWLAEETAAAAAKSE